MSVELPPIGTLLGRIARTEGSVPHDFDVVAVAGPVLHEPISFGWAAERGRMGGVARERDPEAAYAIFETSGGQWGSRWVLQPVQLRAASAIQAGVRTHDSTLLQANGIRRVAMADTHPAALGSMRLVGLVDRRGASLALHHD